MKDNKLFVMLVRGGLYFIQSFRFGYRCYKADYQNKQTESVQNVLYLRKRRSEIPHHKAQERTRKHKNQRPLSRPYYLFVAGSS